MILEKGDPAAPRKKKKTRFECEKRTVAKKMLNGVVESGESKGNSFFTGEGFGSVRFRKRRTGAENQVRVGGTVGAVRD